MLKKLWSKVFKKKPKLDFENITFDEICALEHRDFINFCLANYRYRSILQSGLLDKLNNGVAYHGTQAMRVAALGVVTRFGSHIVSPAFHGVINPYDFNVDYKSMHPHPLDRFEINNQFFMLFHETLNGVINYENVKGNDELSQKPIPNIQIR